MGGGVGSGQPSYPQDILGRTEVSIRCAANSLLVILATPPPHPKFQVVTFAGGINHQCGSGDMPQRGEGEGGALKTTSSEPEGGGGLRSQIFLDHIRNPPPQFREVTFAVDGIILREVTFPREGEGGALKRSSEIAGTRRWGDAFGGGGGPWAGGRLSHKAAHRSRCPGARSGWINSINDEQRNKNTSENASKCVDAPMLNYNSICENLREN